MMLPVSSQVSTGFKFHGFHWTTLPPWTWPILQSTGLGSFLERLHTASLPLSLKLSMPLLPYISLTLKVIQSYMLSPVLSGLRKTNSIINYSAFLHKLIMCTKTSMHIMIIIIKLAALQTWENLWNSSTEITKWLPEKMLSQAMHQNYLWWFLRIKVPRHHHHSQTY